MFPARFQSLGLRRNQSIRFETCVNQRQRVLNLRAMRLRSQSLTTELSANTATRHFFLQKTQKNKTNTNEQLNTRRVSVDIQFFTCILVMSVAEGIEPKALLRLRASRLAAELSTSASLSKFASILFLKKKKKNRTYETRDFL